jgi:LDH2 family malate/lactate/ureidoglycolate dehydrogenase
MKQGTPTESPQDVVRVGPDQLRRQVQDILAAVGLREADAAVTANILLTADMRGVATHGSAKVVRYATLIQLGWCKARPDLRILSESASSALLTCDHGLGFLGAHRAMEIAIAKAKDTGTGSVAVRDGHHIGMVAYYPMMAVTHDMIGLAVTNCGRSVRPALGTRPRVGTNPIAFAAPAGRERPFVLDMATSVVASEKLALAATRGMNIPVGWAAAADGSPILTPPPERGEAWALLPLGGSRLLGAHKGYGLAVMVDILAGVLSGGGYGSEIRFGDNMTFVMALDIAAFRPPDEFKAMMDDMIAALHATPAEEGETRVLVAGDPEADALEEASRNGIPLHRKHLESIRAKAQELGVATII